MNKSNFLDIKEGGICIKLRVIPKSSQNRIDGVREDALIVRVNSVPENGAANKDVINLLSKRLKTPKSNFEIISGAKSKNKVVYVRNFEKWQLLEDII